MTTSFGGARRILWAFACTVLAGCRVSSEPIGPVIVDVSHGINHVNNGTCETRPDGTLVWPKSYCGISAPMDWSPYDYVELTLYNSGSQAISLSFEVKDSQSSGYWTRVNLSHQILGPGLQTMRLPTRLKVGEADKPGRALDDSKVVALTLVREGKNDETPVEIRRIELKKSSKMDAAGSSSFRIGPVIVDGSKGINYVNEGTVEKRADGTLVWPKGYCRISAPMDWSQFDFVEVVLYNPGSQVIPFTFEVKDSQSSDYWTRVNLPQILGPGLQTIKLPTRLRVGETGRPGRALDYSNVLSLTLARGDGNDRTPVEIRRIELKKSGQTDASGDRSSPAEMVIVDASKGINKINNGTFEIRSDGVIVWAKAYCGISAPMDWSPYDFVEMTLFNSGAQAIPLTVEAKDSQSNDYWTRVNLPQIVGPGLQSIKIPTRLRVGETGRPGRELDPANVVSLTLVRDDKNDRAPVEIRRIALKRSAKTSVPGLLAFHAGPEDAGVPDGFEALNENTSYDPAKKWGWLEHNFWAPYPQVNRVMAPDQLTASNLTIASAKLRVDLKPGAYRVWMIIDHPGGFWGEYPYYHRRTVKAQGKLALDERMTPEQAKADYFRWQDAEDHEGDDLFDLYWSRIIKEKSFDTQVENGHLDLEFENHGCPEIGLPCFGLALSALVIFPVNTPAERTLGERWLAQLREARRAEFHSQYQLKAKPLTGRLDAMPSGLRVWNVSADIDLSQAGAADVQPFADASQAKPRLSIFRNSHGIFAPAVSWKASGPTEIGWHIEGLPPFLAVEGGWIKYRALRQSYTGNLYSVRERWVTEEKQRTFPDKDLGRLWLRFLAPKDAYPGLYPAVLVVSARGAGQAVRVPFELRVFKAQADDLDFPVGPFGSNIAEDWWGDSVLRPRSEQLEKQSMSKMRALGITAFSFSPRMQVTARGGTLSLETAEVDRVMTMAKELGFRGVVGYGDLFRGENLCERPKADSVLSGADRLKQLTDLLEAKARARDWLPFALIACDEPVGAAVQELSERLKDLPKVDAQQPVQWSVTTSIGRDSSSAIKNLIREVGLPFLNEFSRDEIRFPWAFYNNSSRDNEGLGLFRLRQSTDVRYRLLWIWNQNMGNPYFDFDGREGDAAWCSSTTDAQLRCSVELDRTVIRGLTDYRVALGLKRTLEERKDLDEALKLEGQALLKEAQSDGVNSAAWLLKAGEYQEKL